MGLITYFYLGDHGFFLGSTKLIMLIFVEVLIQWKDLPPSVATSEHFTPINGKFHNFCLLDKAYPPLGEVIHTPTVCFKYSGSSKLGKLEVCKKMS